MWVRVIDGHDYNDLWKIRLLLFLLDIETDGCRGCTLCRYEVTYMYGVKDLLTIVGEVYLVTSLE